MAVRPYERFIVEGASQMHEHSPEKGEVRHSGESRNPGLCYASNLSGVVGALAHQTSFLVTLVQSSY